MQHLGVHVGELAFIELRRGTAVTGNVEVSGERLEGGGGLRRIAGAQPRQVARQRQRLNAANNEIAAL